MKGVARGLNEGRDVDGILRPSRVGTTDTLRQAHTHVHTGHNHSTQYERSYAGDRQVTDDHNIF